MKVGVLHSRIRVEEKLILGELQSRGVDHEMIDIEHEVFPLDSPEPPERFARFDVILERCISHSRAISALRMFDAWHIPCVNNFQVGEVCGDKMATNLALMRANVRTPKARVAFTPEAALVAIEELGYPAVLKPAVGSWGRLLARVNDRDAAEAVLEHKATLGTYHHSIFYIQEHIEKGNKDLRTFVVDGKVIAAIARHSDHWITNTARGGRTSNVPITDELTDISVRAAAAVGGGIVAIDLFEVDDGLMVNEVNYTMEFKNSITPTGVDIPALIVDYVVNVGEGARPLGGAFAASFGGTVPGV